MMISGRQLSHCHLHQSFDNYKGLAAVFSVIPDAGYVFVSWKDGDTDNPRMITVTTDAVFEAICNRIPDSLDELDSSSCRVTKIIEHGVLYIIRNGEKYTLTGTKVNNQ